MKAPGSHADETEDAASLETQMARLRSRIDDLGREIDSYKAKTGAAIGGGVFLMLLAVGAIYDLVWGSAPGWFPLNVTAAQYRWMTGGLAAAAVCLFAAAAARILGRGRPREAALEELQREFELLSDRDNADLEDGSSQYRL